MSISKAFCLVPGPVFHGVTARVGLSLATQVPLPCPACFLLGALLFVIHPFSSYLCPTFASCLSWWSDLSFRLLGSPSAGKMCTFLSMYVNVCVCVLEEATSCKLACLGWDQRGPWALPSPEPQHLLVGSPIWVGEQGRHCQPVGTQK